MDFFKQIKTTENLSQQPDIKDKQPELTSTPRYNLKNNDRIQIVKYKNSSLNYYKGYIGEIKDRNIKRDKNYVMVFLYAVIPAKLKKFPIEHIKKLDD
jgi:hypothetical protein